LPRAPRIIPAGILTGGQPPLPPGSNVPPVRAPLEPPQGSAITLKTIRVILDWLEGEKMIARESNRRGTRIKVLNYSVYQGGDNGESNTKETPRKHCLPTNKNDKNDKNDKKDLINNIAATINRLF